MLGRTVCEWIRAVSLQRGSPPCVSCAGAAVSSCGLDLTVLPQEWWREWRRWRWWNDDGLTGNGQWNHLVPQLKWWAAAVNTLSSWLCVHRTSCLCPYLPASKQKTLSHTAAHTTHLPMKYKRIFNDKVIVQFIQTGGRGVKLILVKKPHTAKFELKWAGPVKLVSCPACCC